MRPQLRIRTPEGITFAYDLAGPVPRCMAQAIDILCSGLMAGLVGRVLSAAALVSQDFGQALMVVGYFAVSVGYGILLEWALRGQTIGKRIMRLRVMDSGGLRLELHQVIMRNLLRLVDMLPAFYLLGGAVSVLNGRAQRLGDLAAGTVVVYERRVNEPDLDQLMAGKFNSLRDYRHLAARLRQRVRPDQARIGLQALLRRDEFESDARVALFADLADFYKSVVAFPPEAIEAMPDEQYVRNVVDLLFRADIQRAKRLVGSPA